ncbi:MAG: DsbE family thiol:disulfide interchange protein [Thiotrichaceae bacterium]|nr:DsbE family thiol:disulfide interchange protein [Thiotrichaceae bacterium]PCI12443.1 MAG: DsbE family thiol:disulfide interchange protein [Thiotrichales bacterium]
MVRYLKYLTPLLVFLVMVWFLGKGLYLNPRDVPSPLVGKPAPVFSVANLGDPELQFSSEQMKGKVWILNVWASWCRPCRDEHPLFVELGRQNMVPIVGLNYKDQRGDALQWLRALGDPYYASVYDGDGKVGMDFGVYGVPETYVIDQQGIIRYKHTGPVTAKSLEDKVVKLVKELQG